VSEIARLPAAHPAVGGGFASTAALAARDAKLDPRLVSAAHQFEASLMEELLKPLDSSALFGGGEGQDEDTGESAGLGGSASAGDGSGGALMSFSAEALAKALSEKGGLGIARRVLDHFEAAGGGAKPAKPASATSSSVSKADERL
jgi:flagellar protein FlgJ